MSHFADRLAAYLVYRMPRVRDVRVGDVARIPGGSSQETYRFHAAWRDGETLVEQRLILRREPPAGLVVRDGDLEYIVYAALAGHDVPVPAVHFLEPDGRWLDRPFFIMDLAPGRPGVFYTPRPYDDVEAKVARDFWRHLGRLAALDHRALGLERLRNGTAASGVWAAELDRWEAMLDEGEKVVEPVVRGALRWLRRNPPPDPVTPAIVHGDYRSGNFLFLPDGRISAILDWEMCHIGDPLEDVAWALNPMWSIERHLPLDEGFAIWEAASGLTLDRAALDWWRLFSPVKACAIWTTAEASFDAGTNREMVVALSALRANRFHRGEILQRMAERGAMG